ncbi:MAG: hypothetical protein LBC90_06095 [Candidatus Adiutrix sp.]|jgi:hypothetical protein|nr:hypothetical protein [Candidatus Adiutrix sp.]
MSGNEIYPLTLEPIPAEQFQDRSGRPWPAGEVPEFSLGTLWLAADASRVAAGPQAGRSLAYLRHLWGVKLAGLKAGGTPDMPMPLELKLKTTRETSQSLAMTDYSLWYILAAEEDSFIRAGFRPDSAEFAAEAGRCLFLPPGAPLILGPGLTLAQFGPSARLIQPSPEAMADERPPVWLAPAAAGPGEALVFQDHHLTVRLITTAHWSGLTAPEALTFLWPLAGQGRVLTQGPAPTTRLKPGRAVLLPAAMGRYAVESAGRVSYLLLESR